MGAHGKEGSGGRGRVVVGMRLAWKRGGLPGRRDKCGARLVVRSGCAT